MIRESSRVSRSTFTFFISLFAFLLTGCSPRGKPSDVSGVDDVSRAILASNTPTSRAIPATSLTPTHTPMPITLDRATPTPAPYITPSPSESPIPNSTHDASLSPTPTPASNVEGEVVPAPPGLILNGKDGVYKVSGDGSLIQVTHRYAAVISPEGDRALYHDTSQSGNYEIFMIDLSTGEETNLTNTPGREEDSWIFWWPERPGTIIFGSRDVDQWLHVERYLTSISIERANYRLLGGGIIIGPEPAPSPDGRTLAITIDLQPYLYDMETGAQPLMYDAFGLTGFERVRFYSSSWSPDGRKIAWYIRLTTNGKTHDAYAILDRETGGSTLLHPYVFEGVGAFPSAPVWSPDGEWIALRVWHEGLKPQVWALRVDGSEEIHLGPGNRPTWNPAGGQIAFYSLTDGRNADGIWLVNVGEWIPRPVSLPHGFWINDWMIPE